MELDKVDQLDFFYHPSFNNNILKEKVDFSF